MTSIVDPQPAVIFDGSGQPLDLSVVVPAYNEVDNIDPATEEILSVLDGIPGRSELILVDDGSQDGTAAKAMAWARRDDRVKFIQLRRNFGQSAAIAAGFEKAGGQVVVTMDADQQNDPRDIPMLLEKTREGFDVVSGWRVHRQDKLLLRKIPSKLANRLISRVTGTRLKDYGCTLKAYDADVVAQLRIYGEHHRFVPALAVMSGASVAEVHVNHRARTRGTSKYGISRTFRVLLDLITVKFLVSYLSRPMQFFGRLGILSFLGALVVLALEVVKRFAQPKLLSGQPLPTLAVIMIVMAVQFLCMGVLGEMLTRVYHESGARRSYVVRRTEGFDRTEPGGSWDELPVLRLPD